LDYFICSRYGSDSQALRERHDQAAQSAVPIVCYAGACGSWEKRKEALTRLAHVRRAGRCVRSIVKFVSVVGNNKAWISKEHIDKCTFEIANERLWM
jgi:hypothetical protein